MFAIFAIIISGERTALFLLILSYFLFFPFFLLKFFSIKYFILIFILPLLISFHFINDKLTDRIFQDFDKHFSIDTNTSVYASYYKNSYLIFLENPIIGKGPNSFRYECKKYISTSSNYGCNTHPHNTYFQLLAENGLLGFMYIFFIFLYFVFRIYKLTLNVKILERQLIFSEFFLFTIFILNLFPFVTSGNFYNNWLNIFYFLPVGFFLFNEKKMVASGGLEPPRE